MEEIKPKSLVEKAEELNADALERRRIEGIARMLIRIDEEKARHDRTMKGIDAEIKRIVESTLSNFDSEYACTADIGITCPTSKYPRF